MSISPRPPGAHSRPAFSLIELLVVVGVIALLVGLALPALAKARETANRLKCAVNLKQIGVGLGCFHNDNRAFPIGTALVGYPSTLPESSIPIGLLNSGPYRPGAFAMILPYLGQQGLANGLAMNTAIDAEPNKTLGQTQVPLYLCPSAKHVYGLAKAPHSLPLTDTTLQLAVIDYTGLNGAARLFTAAPSSGLLNNQGGFSERKALKLEDFTDGPAQTIHVVESVNFGRGVWIHGRPHYNQSAYGVNSLNGYNNGAGSVYPDGSNSPVTNRGPGKGSGGTWGMGSDHPGGANTLFVDGSAHFLRNSLSAETLTALSTRNGGEGISDQWN